MNYSKLMAFEPTHYGTMTNSIGQIIDFYEHPIQGDESPVIAVSHVQKLAAKTDFYELDDMVADHGEYEPWFDDGQLFIGGA